MSVSFIIFIIIHICILVFFVESLRRIAKRAHEYPLDETPETLPFGFLKLRHIIILYFIVYLLWVLFSIWIYFVFVDPSFFSATSSQSGGSGLMLNL
ncbi:hypothetical protein JXA05_04490 [Candidatus Peregrinibacteria bacterium]|nr:hypothetical protein [Candidatus Peregrinibacteria bacterium]